MTTHRIIDPEEIRAIVEALTVPPSHVFPPQYMGKFVKSFRVEHEQSHDVLIIETEDD